jgi:hypothetical protein
MLGRRSLIIGAPVQAINVAIHISAEQKNGISKETAMEMKQALEASHP